MHANRRITLIVAMDRNRVIGRDGEMPWHLPADLRHFKETTLGHPIVMGRRTLESIGRALPGRQNVVITRDMDYQFEGCDVVYSLDDALRVANGDEVMIVGGGEIYRQALPWADRLVITEVDVEVEGGDTWFPDWDRNDWQEVSRREQPADERNAHDLVFSEWIRRAPD